MVSTDDLSASEKAEIRRLVPATLAASLLFVAMLVVAVIALVSWDSRYAVVALLCYLGTNVIVFWSKRAFPKAWAIIHRLVQKSG